ncbi:MAG: HAD family hydrolase [Acutalibacteraceae bacterium]|nr:HAD family hydrolase [Acutalibacteraceae bacterium]
MDGTLLNKESSLTDYSKNTINTFVKNGGIFTYATARSFKSSSIVTKGLNITAPVIIYNGAFIYDSVNDKYLHSVIFSADEIKDIITLAKMYNNTPLVYTFVNGEEKVLWDNTKELSYGFRYYLSKRANDKRMTPVDSVEQSFCGDIFYITFIDDYDNLLPVYNAIKNNPKFNTIFQQEIYRTEYWCEIMPKQATKANAIKKLKELLKCDELVVFGDSFNDIPMFEIADKSYAVMNAKHSLKQIATEVIGYNYENSVASKLFEIEKNLFVK